MAFNSLAYVLLLSVTGLLVATTRWPALVLSIASLVFYMAAGPFDTAVFLSAVAANWAIQTWLPANRLRITAAVIVNIGLIGFFKYKSFLLGATNLTGSYVDTSLPLGISFYSFQALAYHIDVVRRQSPPARSLREFFLFKAFFPQLVAGPIVRAHQLLPQIRRLFDGYRRRHRLLSFGFGLIALGIVKKVVFADSIAPIVDDIFFHAPTTAYSAWMGAVLFAFQIYFDFSGYSDIAIGSAYLLGLRLPWNFHTPYMSRGPREFWRRWHISLSTWIRDYLYIPLGGGHGGLLRTSSVLIGVMGLAGLWHGANYTFIVWGAAWGVYILAGRLMPLGNVPMALRWPFHMAIVTLLWVFFRSPDLGYALHYLGTMLSFRGGLPAPVDGAAPVWEAALGIAALFVLHWLESRLQTRAAVYALRRFDGPILWGLFAGISILLILIPVYNPNPFIYFRF